MTQIIYTFFIHLYKSAITFASLFNGKASDKVEGVRKSKMIFHDIKSASSEKLVLIHCASQGEHEQALPIIRWILNITKYNIVLSFSSPSGFNNVNYDENLRINKIYLPFDTPEEMTNLVSCLPLHFVIIIKNEWWWNFLNVLKKLRIQTYLVSATVRKEHYFVKYKNRFFRNGFQTFAAIFVIDQESKRNISKVYDGKVTIAGDTRIDQVIYNKNETQNRTAWSKPKAVKESGEIIVYGSIWESDLESIKMFIALYPSATHLIYPHDLSDTNIKILQSAIADCKLIIRTVDASDRINLITSMGELKYAYNIATFAYIGGGFGAGIHNVLEAAVFNIPTIFGSNYLKSNEAKNLVLEECSFTFKEIVDLKSICANFRKEKKRKEIEAKLKSYFSPQVSPTELICKEIFKISAYNV